MFDDICLGPSPPVAVRGTGGAGRQRGWEARQGSGRRRGPRKPLLYYTTLYYTLLHYTTLHYTTLHYTTLHYTILYYTILYYTTLHYTTLY